MMTMMADPLLAQSTTDPLQPPGYELVVEDVFGFCLVFSKDRGPQ